MQAEITQPTITTMSLDEAAVIRAAGHIVTVERKPCSLRAMFIFADAPAIRDLLDHYHRREVMPIPQRLLMIARSNLYREARAARGGL